MDEMKLVSLKCPNCGGQLEIGPSIETFACGYCGANVEVERSGNIVALHVLTDVILGVQRGTDRTAAELAIRRLTDEIASLQREQEANMTARQSVESKWAREIKSIGASDAVVPIGFVALLVCILATGIVRQVSWMNSTIATLLTGAVTVVAAFMSWRVIRKQQLNLRIEKQEMRERELTPLAEMERDVLRRIQMVKDRLQIQRKIVDS